MQISSFLIIAAMAASADAWENRGAWGQGREQGWNQQSADEGLQGSDSEEQQWGGRRANDPDWAIRPWGTWGEKNMEEETEEPMLYADEDEDESSKGNAWAWGRGGRYGDEEEAEEPMLYADEEEDESSKGNAWAWGRGGRYGGEDEYDEDVEEETEEPMLYADEEEDEDADQGHAWAWGRGGRYGDEEHSLGSSNSNGSDRQAWNTDRKEWRAERPSMSDYMPEDWDADSLMADGEDDATNWKDEWQTSMGTWRDGRPTWDSWSASQ